MNEDKVLHLMAEISDGILTIQREDGQPISIIERDEISGDCIEVLEINSSGNAVKALQALLCCHGQHIAIDGIFGPMTQTALIIYQDKCGLPATGTCDKLTWERMIEHDD